MRNRVTNFLRNVTLPKRNPDWPRVRREHLAKNPSCWECGNTYDLEVHHILPFHLFPEKELDPSNLITLCETMGWNCHLNVGHLGSWKNYNPELVGMGRAF